MKTILSLSVFIVTAADFATGALGQEKQSSGLEGDENAGDRAAGETVRWEKRSRFGPGRILHSALWTYGGMIVWGGGSEHQFYNSGGIYDPATDQWRAVSQIGAPSGRWGHAAVWTGKEMIIWGGRSSFAPACHHSDGAIYDPYTDTWRAMTTEGAPSGRSQMAAVWTGQELIVWGGWADGGECPATGASYDPRTDRWTELPGFNAPEGRIEPACVWTGREMIVWGGLLEGERRCSGTGGRYDPEKRTWTPLPAEGAPAPARGHTAVWTGKEMIVWGGSKVDESSKINIATNAGGRYSPEDNRWRETPIPSALEGRFYHAAAWSDQDVVVWGGGDQQKGAVASGGLFNPVSGTWRIISAEGAPAPRSMSTAVWTGDGILIYGGSTGGTAAFDETYYLRIPAR